MQKFDKLKGRAAHLNIINVDTDMIIPKQFLKTIKRTGLGVNLFDELRYNSDGSEKADFVLNKEPFRKAVFLVSGENFGCGSSREHAPWAIADFGIRCIIAPSFADIFFNNCFKNSILPISLSASDVAEIAKVAEIENNEFEVDLNAQKVVAGGKEYKFEIDEFRKYCLVNGLDDIGLTLQKKNDIDAFEAKMKSNTPWL